jgi:hypothetical protein
MAMIAVYWTSQVCGSRDPADRTRLVAAMGRLHDTVVSGQPQDDTALGMDVWRTTSTTRRRGALGTGCSPRIYAFLVTAP